MTLGKFGTTAPREGTSCVWGVGKKASAKLRQDVVKYEQRKRRFLWFINGLAKHSSAGRGWGGGGAMGHSQVQVSILCLLYQRLTAS